MKAILTKEGSHLLYLDQTMNYPLADTKIIKQKMDEITSDLIVKMSYGKNIHIKFSNVDLTLTSFDLLEDKTLIKLKKKIEKELMVIKLANFCKKTKIKLTRNNLKKIVIITGSIVALTVAGLSNNDDVKINALVAQTTAPAYTNSFQKNGINVYTQKNNIVSPKIENVLETIQYTQEENIIRKYAKMYSIDYDAACDLMENAKIDKTKSYELNVIATIRNDYWNNNCIDKTSIQSNLTEEQKENLILEFANIYGIKDENTLSTLIAVHRLETGYGTSKIYLESNNCGGVFQFVKGNGSLAKYKTIEIGAESFVRNFIHNIELANQGIENNDSRYDSNKSLAYNLNVTYCQDITEPGKSWHEIVDEIKETVKESDLLREYISKTM